MDGDETESEEEPEFSSLGAAALEAVARGSHPGEGLFDSLTQEISWVMLVELQCLLPASECWLCC